MVKMHGISKLFFSNSDHRKSVFPFQIGVDFALKVIQWDANTIVRIQLWDIAGQERFGSMTRVYYKDAVGALISFDVTKHQTLEAVKKWKEDLDFKVTLPDGSPIPAVLVANKVAAFSRKCFEPCFHSISWTLSVRSQ